MSYSGNYKPPGKSVMDANYSTNNIASNKTDEGMFLGDSNGYRDHYVVKYDGHITQIALLFDNSANEYNNWSNGTISFSFWVNDVRKHTTATYTKTLWASQLTSVSTNMLAGILLTLTTPVPVMEADLVNMTFTTNSTWSPTGQAEIQTNLTFVVAENAGTSSGVIASDRIQNNNGYCKIDNVGDTNIDGKFCFNEEQTTPTAPADGNGWLYTKSDGKIYWQSYDVAETDLTSGGSGGASDKIFNSNGKCEVQSNGDIYIDTKLGIGTDAPGTLIHLKKETTTSGQPVEMLRLQAYEGSGQNLQLGDGPSINFHVAEGDPPGNISELGGKLAVVRESGTDTNGDASMTFWTALSDVSPTEKMRITSTGLVGVGTTSPSAKLEVSGSSTGDGAIIGNTKQGVWDSNSGFACWNHKTGGTGLSYALLQEDDGRTMLNTATGKNITFRVNNTQKMEITSDGLVGINASSPTCQLEVESNTLPQLKLRNPTASPNGWTFRVGDTGALVIKDDGTEVVRFLADGKMGIGTSSPECLLDVDGDIRANGDDIWIGAISATAGNRLRSHLATSGVYYDWLTSSGTSGPMYWRYNGTGTAMKLSAFGALQASSYTNLSDDRCKFDEEPITSGVSTIMKLDPQLYRKSQEVDIDENTFLESGFIAQDVYYIPELEHLVTPGEGHGVIPDTKPPQPDPKIDPPYTEWGPNPASLNYNGLMAYMVKAIQEQQNTIDELLLRVSALENA